ncbi:SH3 domain-containing protein 19 [Scaptodrosophila lebanonensis]|uniref:SH3 domain-containing protein 19 n=1 Tax=Drosophila lebanonensis TaxID=7225 RepID=A0A6J2THI8_DROLE|nr:SH3 domain-containing protein 19 [Scaptodrosophila lebanonensis]XP_030374498.1 SH3 domain-containing protein 19 [Scaptodrosophila lebanonensis]
MTIPSRPAPAPPGSLTQSSNGSVEQLRLRLQQQHMQQQQAGGGLQKLTIKLPPPPKAPLQNGMHSNNNNNNSSNNNNHGFYDLEGTNGSRSITRKFPQARYTPATNWNGAPFGSAFGDGGSSAATSNGNFKKVPPPRPPPPKVQSTTNGRKASAPNAGSGSSLITSIFHRKKSTTSTSMVAASKAAAQNRVYGLSSGHATTSNASSTVASTTITNSNYDWNAAWNSAPTITATAATTTAASTTASSGCATEAQLISFDSPPSSPTFTQKSNSDCVSVDSFSSDSNFSSPNNGSVSQPESGFEDDYHARSRPATTSPLDPWEVVDNTAYAFDGIYANTQQMQSIGTAPVRQLQQPSRSVDNPLCNGKSLLPPPPSLTMPTIIKPKISAKPKAPKPPPFLSQPPGYVLPYGGDSGIDSSTPPSPPMPKEAPPPLPSAVTSSANSGISLLDVIMGKVDALALSNGSSGYVDEPEVPYAIALYDFDGVEEGDLNFRENEKIYLVDQPTADWFRGRTRAGCEGIFPANYVEVKVPLGACGGAGSSQVAEQLPMVRCLYNFPGEVEGDLAIQENELVTVLYRINEDWLFGEIAGRQGQFPANFLEYVPDNLPTA